MTKVVGAFFTQFSAFKCAKTLYLYWSTVQSTAADKYIAASILVHSSWYEEDGFTIYCLFLHMMITSRMCSAHCTLCTVQFLLFTCCCCCWCCCVLNNICLFQDNIVIIIWKSWFAVFAFGIAAALLLSLPQTYRNDKTHSPTAYYCQLHSGKFQNVKTVTQKMKPYGKNMQTIKLSHFRMMEM